MLFRVLLATGLLAGLAAQARSEIEVSRRADGTIVVSNDGSSRPRMTRVRGPRETWDETIVEAATAHRLDPRLVRAVIQVESGFDPRAVSSKGAMGLMQLMPETARLLEVSDPFSPEENIKGGTAYLRRLLVRFDESLELALAAYNAGPSAVERYRGIPPFRETRSYVRKVMTLFTGRAPELPPAARPRSSPPNRDILVRRGPDGNLLVTTAPEKK